MLLVMLTDTRTGMSVQSMSGGTDAAGSKLVNRQFGWDAARLVLHNTVM
jgi:hypothetical protein